MIRLNVFTHFDDMYFTKIELFNSYGGYNYIS